MFERFRKPPSPEKAEIDIRRIVARNLKDGVNSPTMQNAFNAAREKNESGKYGLTDNHILNILKEEAQASITPEHTLLMDSVYPDEDGNDKILQDIDMEIEQIRQGLSFDESKS